MASERVRMARALDAVEKVVLECCEAAVARARESEHFQIDIAFDIWDAVNEAAIVYGVDLDALARETWPMLRNGLNRYLRPVCEVRYVKPHERDGMTVGMAVRFYKIERSVV